MDFKNTSVSTSYAEILSSFNFSLSWPNDYFWQWYFLGVKLTGTGPYINSTLTAPSYANITYEYTDTPAIKTLNNTDIDVLAAYMDNRNAVNATVILDGIGHTNLTLEMPNATKRYRVRMDGVDCTLNANCTMIYQQNGEIALDLQLG
ncbi:MAG: hypothetical protein ABIG30_03430 [Candidatus Aenigmatarchaeota archaeon]